MVARLESPLMSMLVRSTARAFRIFLVLMIAVAIVWITNSVDSTVQSALPYVFATLLAWEFTRVLTVRRRRRRRSRPKLPPIQNSHVDPQERVT